jgi:hypothetical protein
MNPSSIQTTTQNMHNKPAYKLQAMQPKRKATLSILKVKK